MKIYRVDCWHANNSTEPQLKPGLGVFERSADAGLDVVTAERTIIKWLVYGASRNFN